MKDAIAVFDSGVGGISVLRELVKQMPAEDFYFFGDSANAPYGTKSTEEVRRLTTGHVERFIAGGAKGVCIARFSDSGHRACHQARILFHGASAGACYGYAHDHQGGEV